MILVEGWSEELLIPEIAKKIDCDLTKEEVSIVNVGSTAYLDFAKVFLRKENNVELEVPVSIVTDLDEREYEREAIIENGEHKKVGKKKQYSFVKKNITNHDNLVEEKENQILDKKSDFVKPFISKQWTFEWCLLKSTVLGTSFIEILKIIHSDTFKNKDTEDEYELGLAKLLLNESLKKTELAYQLSEKVKELNSLDFKEEDTFYYIVNAIKHACKNGN